MLSLASLSLSLVVSQRVASPLARSAIVCAAAEPDAKAVKAAAAKLKAAAASFGPMQRDAANIWLDRTLSSDGFNTAALLKQKKLLFEECTIDDDGSNKCKALDDALVDLQEAIAAAAKPVLTGSTKTKQRLAQSKVNKAALAVRAAAAKFGPAQKKLADAWVQRALEGGSKVSLFESSIELFGECELSEEGSKAPNKCLQLSNALEALRMALGDVDDVRGVVVPVSQMSDLEYRKYMAGETVMRRLN